MTTKMKKHLTLKFILVITISLSTFVATNAQTIKGYASLGANISQVDGDQAYGFKKFGANAGVGAEIKIWKNISASIEANFNQKGSRRNLFKDYYTLNLNYVEVPVLFHITDGSVKFGIGASYSSPVGSQKEIDVRQGIGSFIVAYNKSNDFTTYAQYREAHLDIAKPIDRATKYFEDVVVPWNEDNGNFSKHHFNIIGSVSFKIWKNLKAEVRYSYSLNSIRTADYYFFDGITFNNRRTKYDLYVDGSQADRDWFECFRRKEMNNCISLRLLYYFNEQQVKANEDKNKSAGGEVL